MTTEALFPVQQSSPAAETPSVESALDVQIVADKRQSMVIELVGMRYTVKVPKASLALKLAVRAKQADDNPALLAQTIDEWISRAFSSEDAESVKQRLYESDDDDLDLPHIMKLMEALIERTTDNPSS